MMNNTKIPLEEKTSPAGLLKRLRKDRRGFALTEFALSLPILMGLGCFGLEISNMAIINMQLSQAALSLADNASRLGQTNSGLVSPTITESDVMRIFRGTALQGSNLDLLTKGRVILSSLELDGNNKQLIRWQRCKGKYNATAAYGGEGKNGTTDSQFTGMGATGSKVTAVFDTAIMFVELEYKFEGLFGDLFISPRTIRQEAAFNIRDDRNLAAGLGDNGGPKALCSKFNDTF